MESKQFGRNDPEKKIQDAIILFLRARHWFVKPLHGGMFQSGMPDLFCSHKRYGIKLIEVKLPYMRGSRFTKDQLLYFPQLVQNGCPIWILTDACTQQYNLLFDKPDGNFHEYLMLK